MPDDAPVLDESILADLLASTDGDTAFVRELVETYLADVPVQLAGIADAVAANDAGALVRPAHSLKSASLTVGAVRLSGIARELEMAGRSGTLDDAAQSGLKSAQSEADAAAAAMHAWLDREAG